MPEETTKRKAGFRAGFIAGCSALAIAGGGAAVGTGVVDTTPTTVVTETAAKHVVAHESDTTRIENGDEVLLIVKVRGKTVIKRELRAAVPPGYYATANGYMVLTNKTR